MGQYQEQHGRFIFKCGCLFINDHNTAQFNTAQFFYFCSDNNPFLRLRIWNVQRCSCMELRSKLLKTTIWNTALTFVRSQSVYTAGMTATYGELLIPSPWNCFSHEESGGHLWTAKWWTENDTPGGSGLLIQCIVLCRLLTFCIDSGCLDWQRGLLIAQGSG